jgi:hypothetical protein
MYREQCDEYALRSQLLWAAGHADGAFEAEIAPVEVCTSSYIHKLLLIYFTRTLAVLRRCALVMTLVRVCCVLCAQLASCAQLQCRVLLHIVHFITLRASWCETVAA